MTLNTDALFEAARQLPEKDRMTLVSRLLETMPDAESFFSEDDPEFLAELNRRFADPEGEVHGKDLLGEP